MQWTSRRRCQEVVIDVAERFWSTASLFPETSVATEVGDDTTNGSASISLSPDGRFVYASNRGHDSIAVLAVTGSGLTLIGLTRISPDLAAHEASAFTHLAKWPPVQCPRDFNFLVKMVGGCSWPTRTPTILSF